MLGTEAAVTGSKEGHVNPIVGSFSWIADWIWSLPLIVLSLVIHVFGLALIYERVVGIMSRTEKRRHGFFTLVLITTVLLITVLHAMEGAIWAVAYLFLGALSDTRSAMLYSISAMTTYGHEGLRLEDHWQLMGTLEALDGMLLFGLTTAFLFAMIQKVWVPENGSRYRR